MQTHTSPVIKFQTCRLLLHQVRDKPAPCFAITSSFFENDHPLSSLLMKVLSISVRLVQRKFKMWKSHVCNKTAVSCHNKHMDTIVFLHKRIDSALLQPRTTNVDDVVSCKALLMLFFRIVMFFYTRDRRRPFSALYFCRYFLVILIERCLILPIGVQGFSKHYLNDFEDYQGFLSKQNDFCSL